MERDSSELPGELEQSLLLPLQTLGLLTLLAVLKQEPHQPALIVLHKPPEGLTGVPAQRDDQLSFPLVTPPMPGLVHVSSGTVKKIIN